MIRFAFIASLLLSVGALGTSPTQVMAQSDLADLIERSERSVVRIDVKGTDGEDWLGSGFVIESAGVIVTNHHVIEGAATAQAVFQDGRSFDIVGTKLLQADQDIAVVKIDAFDLPTLEIADQLPRKGELVVAFGSPHGLSFTASQGIISGIRDVTAEEAEGFGPVTLLQTTAPISSGNSGGPLINSQGKVVGMNTLTSTIGQNLNFAVSCVDIQKAVTAQSLATVTSLARSTANLKPKMDLPKREEFDLSDEAINRYLAETRRLEAGLKSDVAKRLKNASDRLATFKRGRVGEHKELSSSGRFALVKEANGRMAAFFRTDIDKEKAVLAETASLESLKQLATTLKDSDPKQTLFELARNSGAPIETRRIGEVGFVQDYKILTFLSDQSFIALSNVDRQAFTVEGEPIDRLHAGDVIAPFAAYIAGETSFKIGDRVFRSLMIRRVPDSRLATLVFGADSIPKHLAIRSTAEGNASPPAGQSPSSSPPAAASNSSTSASTDSDLMNLFKPNANQSRLWSDQSGKFQIKAVFVSQDSRQVILRREDNQSLLIVPKEKLSAVDRQYLQSLE